MRGGPATRSPLDASSAAEADRHFPAFDDHRHFPPPARVLEHPLQVGWILLHVDVLERHLALLVVVARGERVGAGVLSENQHFVGGHRLTMTRIAADFKPRMNVVTLMEE